VVTTANPLRAIGRSELPRFVRTSASARRGPFPLGFRAAMVVKLPRRWYRPSIRWSCWDEGHSYGSIADAALTSTSRRAKSVELALRAECAKVVGPASQVCARVLRDIEAR